MAQDLHHRGELSTTEIDELLHAAAAAPSSFNSQPWRLTWTGDAVEVRGDPARQLLGSDPDGRAVRLACGAALANIRLTVRNQGRRAHCRLLPTRDDPWVMGRVRPGAAAPPLPWEQDLARVISRRRTDRGPFAPRPLSSRHRDELTRAAEREACWLVFLDDPSERARLREIAADAHHTQRSDAAFRAEWAAWVGDAERSDDGIPVALARQAPRPDGLWRWRDFAGAADLDHERPAAHRDDQPAIAVVATFRDSPLTHLQAGQAMQQVLLTGTARGLGASFVAPPVELPEHRDAVRDLLGGGLWPQVILRLGFGGLPPATPRRSPGAS